MALLGLLLIALYFVPSGVAMWRNVKNQGSVIVVNLLLGWTLVGWAVALAMAARTDRMPEPWNDDSPGRSRG